MSFIPRPQEIYKHFKGNLYQVTAIATHSETREQLVIYQALYGDFRIYARPLAMFVSRVDREKYPDATQEFRFELQRPEAGRQRAESEPESLGAGGAGNIGEAPGAQETDCGDSRIASGARETGCGGSRIASGERETGCGGNSGTASGEREMGCADGTGTAPGEKEAEHEDVAPESVSDAQPEELEAALDPFVLEFLDADTYEQRLNILAGLHHRITDEMITTMAIACDIEVDDGDTEERYEALKTCLQTLERYECNRLR